MSQSSAATGPINTPEYIHAIFDPMSITGLDTETLIEATGITVHTTQHDDGNWFVCATETLDPDSPYIGAPMMFSNELEARTFETYLVQTLRHLRDGNGGYIYSDVRVITAARPADYSCEPCNHIEWVCTEMATEKATMDCSSGKEACCGCCRLHGTAWTTK